MDVVQILNIKLAKINNNFNEIDKNIQILLSDENLIEEDIADIHMIDKKLLPIPLINIIMQENINIINEKRNIILSENKTKYNVLVEKITNIIDENKKLIKEQIKRDKLLKKRVNKGEDNVCCICMENINDHIVVPCGHKCICSGECKEGLLKCPMCREDIIMIIKCHEN